MKPGTLGINYLSDMDFGQQLPFWYVMALLEFGRLKSGWENPFTNGSLFSLKDDFQPGNHLNVDVDKVSDRAYNSELSNGRLAMLAVLRCCRFHHILLSRPSLRQRDLAR